MGADYLNSCRKEDPRCTSTVRKKDGTLPSTYEQHTPVAGGVGIRRVAELLQVDGTRVVVSASNVYDRPPNAPDSP